MAGKTVTLQHVAELIAQGQNRAVERWDDLKTDFDAKHKENVERRHALGNQYAALEGRVTIVETKLTAIVGDNSGGSGLLHEIRDDLKKVQTEVASIKQTVQDTPSINKWVYGAMAVLGFVVIVLPMILFVLFEVIKIITKH